LVVVLVVMMVVVVMADVDMVDGVAVVALKMEKSCEGTTTTKATCRHCSTAPTDCTHSSSPCLAPVRTWYRRVDLPNEPTFTCDPRDAAKRAEARRTSVQDESS